MKKVKYLMIASVIALIFIVPFSATAQKSVWQHLDKDKPDPTKAVLAVTSDKVGGAISVIEGHHVHELLCPVNSKYNFTEDKKNEETFVRYYYVEPGTYEFTTYATSIILPNYPAEIYNKYFFFKDMIFRLEAGKAYYFGHVNVNIPTIIVNKKHIVDPNAKQTCTIDPNVEHRVTIRERFQKNLPNVFNFVEGVIEQVTFTQGHYICSTGKVIFDEKFKDNSRGWKTSNNGMQKSYIADNSLVIENNGLDSCILTIPVNISDNFDVELETTWMGGENNKGFGLIIGDEKFTITNNGYFCVKLWGKRVNMLLRTFETNWSKYDCINTGTGAKNIIKVQSLPYQSYGYGMLFVYVNNVLVERINITKFNKKGVIGVFSFGKQNVAFNRLIYSELE